MWAVETQGRAWVDLQRSQTRLKGAFDGLQEGNGCGDVHSNPRGPVPGDL